MKLQELLKGVAVTEVHADLETEVASIVYDSRKAVPGCLFAAISGFASDGNRFIPMAVERGAVVTVTAKKPDVETPYVLVASDRLALAQMACNFYGNPAKSMQCIGITGTNGKTSVTLLLKSVLEQTRGAKVGLIGTMGNLVGQETIPSERTTPESLELQQLFARMRDAGCQYAVMEVSSHAIALDRIGGVHYDVAAFTNLTEDHLDFHRTMDAYCDTKAVTVNQEGCRQAYSTSDGKRWLTSDNRVYGADAPGSRLSGSDGFCPQRGRAVCKGYCPPCPGRGIYGGLRRRDGPRGGAHSRPLYGLQCPDGAGRFQAAWHFSGGMCPSLGKGIRCQGPH